MRSSGIRLEPLSCKFTVNGQADTGTLTWSANGTLASLGITDSISETSDSQDCTYTYDDLVCARIRLARIPIRDSSISTVTRTRGGVATVGNREVDVYLRGFASIGSLWFCRSCFQFR